DRRFSAFRVWEPSPPQLYRVFMDLQPKKSVENLRKSDDTGSCRTGSKSFARRFTKNESGFFVTSCYLVSSCETIFGIPSTERAIWYSSTAGSFGNGCVRPVRVNPSRS